jgi:hypothetical protein
MNDINYIGGNELIFNKDSEAGIFSGGFNINSIMMKAGMSPIMTINNENQTGGSNVSDLFESLVIPNWALSYSNRMKGGEYKENFEDEDDDSDDDINDDLHEKLLGLVKEHESKLNQQNKKKKTRKQTSLNIKKRTRKSNIK